MVSVDSNLGAFPFGEPVRAVVERDRRKRDVFVLGVYSSAVHARWIGPRGGTRVMALAVANEPCPFWKGEGVDEIIARIQVPEEAGRLVSAGGRFNGPSGIALEDDALKPLGLIRNDVWCADLVTHSCANAGQRKAIEREYVKVASRLGLPEANMPELPKRLADDTRRDEIVAELEESGARVLITLGTPPLRWFLSAFGGRKSLQFYGRHVSVYGHAHQMTIARREYAVVPLAHPRQTGGLGMHSTVWREVHSSWKAETAAGLKTGLGF